MDKRAKIGLETDQYAMTQFMPNSINQRAAINTTNASSTDNMTLDPGYSDNLTRQLLYKNLTPCSQQPGCQM